MIIHTVEQGETLFSVANKYAVDPVTLGINNGVREDGQLAVGQSLIIIYPDVEHTVQRGETLYSIARKYGVSVNQLYRNNLKLKSSSLIQPGMKLIISIKNSYIGNYMTAGYAYPFINLETLNLSLPFMGGLMPFTYGFTLDGSLVMLNDEILITRAREYGVKYVMHLSTLTAAGVFSSELATIFLNNKDIWGVLVNNILKTMKSKGYYGLDIDFEFLGAENALAYVEFIDYTTKILNAQGYPVMVALAPKTSVDQPGILYEGHDYKAIGNVANSVLLMTYEWGYTYGPPMAVSPIESVERVVQFAVTQIEPSKMFLGISNYGYDFVLPYIPTVSRANSISTVEAVNLAIDTGSDIRYDEESQAPFFLYTKDNKEHIVWFEDARSLNARLNLMPKYGLRGAMYWNLNRDNPQNLTLINSIINLQNLNLF